MSKVAIVTGATSGIGLMAALALKKRGWTVYGVSRRDAGVEGIMHLSADVSDEHAAQNVADTVYRACGRIDALINAAGFGISGALEYTRPDDARRQMEVNVIGTANLCRAVIAPMRARGGGRIINVSSVAAVLPIPFQAWYSASKAAINAYTLALANEVKPFGISVCAVMPGDIATGFTAARKKDTTGDDIYAGRIEKAVSAMEKDEKNGMRPEIVGEYLARTAERKRVKPLYTVGFMYRAFVIISRILPCRFVNAVVGKLY